MKESLQKTLRTELDSTDTDYNITAFQMDREIKEGIKITAFQMDREIKEGIKHLSERLLPVKIEKTAPL